MRYTQYIAAFVAFIFATACTIADVDNTINVSGGDNVTVMGRITRFTDKDVTSRASKDPQTEGNLYNMAVALFRIENGVIGKCDFFEYKVGSEVLFTIDRKIKDGNNYIYLANNHYAMYIFANCAAMEQFETNDEYKTTSLETMKAVASSVSNLDIPVVGDNVGFPMMGSLGDYITAEGDGKTFILKPGTDDVPTLPQISDKKGDMVETDLLTIPLQALFSKINFTIKVTPDQTVEDNPSPRFTLDNYSVNNVPTSVAFGKDLNTTAKTDTVANDAVATYSNIKTVTSLTNYAMGASTITFSFYIPERYLTPQTESKDYNYPFGTLEDGDKDENNNGIRDEDEKYRQRFKPLLPSDSQKATYVTITGTFRDHQNHSWDVTYDIYLGENNYSDFNIKRNCEYNNYITIRGIQASDDMSDNLNGVAIDHRVNVERTQPAIISLRRETLLDSHFEVRPLRIRKNDNVTEASDYHALVEVVYKNNETTPWIGLERKSTDGGSNEHLSTGKRKYFTTNLVTSTLAGKNSDLSAKLGQQVVVPITATEECIWIYVDECLSTGDDVRSATIRVTYGTLNGSNFTPDSNYSPIDYTINQRYLFEVTYGTNTYYIEYEEEYLHNFDADDNYGSTEDDGMVWGLNGLQLSTEHKSAYVKEGSGFIGSLFNRIINAISNNDAIRYDFYLEVDKNSIENGTFHSHYGVGLDFSSEIVKEADISYLQLDTKPSSAIQYCYNRNKRNTDGSISMNWYMPSITEIEEIMMSNYSYAGETHKTYIRFMDFQGKPYWSSQPAYIRNYLDYNILSYDTDGWFYMDDTDRARATKVEYSNSSYSTIKSGVTDGKYTNTLYVRKMDGISPRVVMTPTTTRGSEGLYYEGEDASFYQPGNLPRMSKARVRCVRKMN